MTPGQAPDRVRTPQLSFHRSDGTPKYVAIAKSLAVAITDGQFAEGQLLPSQRELADSFGVTIMTVRQAIQLLADQGLVVPSQGRGTYVGRPPYALSLGPLASFAEQIRRTGRTLQTKVLGSGPVDVSPVEQRRMGLATAAAFEIVRLRIVDEQPVIVQTSLLSPAIGGQVEVAELVQRSLYDLLRDIGVRVASASETVQATSLDAHEARILGRPAGEAALISARLSRDVDGRAILDDRALAAGSSVIISTERKADETGLTLALTEHAQVPMRWPSARLAELVEDHS